MSTLRSTMRSTFSYDASGVHYRSRAELTDLVRQWNTFERIENYNFVVLNKLATIIPSAPGQLDGSVFLRPADYDEKIDYTKGQLAHIARYPDISDFLVPYANREIPYSQSTISSFFSTFTSTMTVPITYTSTYTSTYMSSMLSIVQHLPYNPVYGPPTQIIPVSSDYSEILQKRKARNLYISVSSFTAKYPKSPYKFSSSDEYLLYKKYRDTNC